MGPKFLAESNWVVDLAQSLSIDNKDIGLLEAEATLKKLGGVFPQRRAGAAETGNEISLNPPEEQERSMKPLNVEARYRALVEQIPAVVFMAYLDKGIGEAYVSPQIEAALGFSQMEWLEDPMRWYQQIHPDDKRRWSSEAAEMFLTGKPLRSAYRVLSRDGQGALVSLRSQNDPPRGWLPLVCARGGSGYHRIETGGDGTAGRTQRTLRHSRYRRRPRCGARSQGEYCPV